MVLVVGLFAWAGLWALSGRTVQAPDWVLTRLETRINLALAPQGHVRLGGLDLVFSLTNAAQVRLYDVDLYAPDAERRRWWGGTERIAAPLDPLLHLPVVLASLSGRALLGQRIEPRSLDLAGGTITVHRLEDGRLDLSLGSGLATTGTLAEVLDRLEGVLATPAVGGLEEIRAEGLTVVLQDVRARRTWETLGDMQILRKSDAIEVALSLNAIGGDSDGGMADLQFVAATDSSEAWASAAFVGVDASDIAAQSPALAWLAAMETKVGGSLSARIDAAGAVQEIEGALYLEAGALRPTEGMTPVPFDAASVEFSLDPATRKITIPQLSIDSAQLDLRARGHATAVADAGKPLALLGQFQIDSLSLDPEGQFATPARLDGGMIDMRLVADPFRIEFGQIAVQRGQSAATARGTFFTDADGWAASLDAKAAALDAAMLLDFWPVGLAPGTRGWLSENLVEGSLSNVTVALRAFPGARPSISLSFDYSDTVLRVMRTLPPVTGARGHASLHDHVFTLAIDAGAIEAPVGGAIDLAGTLYQVPDMTQRPARGQLSLKGDGPLTAALSLLDQPPFEFMSKAGLDEEVAEGRVRFQAQVENPLVRPVPPELITVSASGRMIGVRSTTLVPGRSLVAPELDFSLANERLEIGGAGVLDGVPFRVTWSRGIRSADDGVSRLAGTVLLSDAAARTFGVSLPEGSVAGIAPADLALVWRRDAAPEFTLRSELVGLDLRLPQLGWSKPSASAGALLISGRLGPRPEVDVLSITAPGLSASGSVSLASGGGLDRARFQRVRIGGWLDAVVELRGRGKDVAPAIAVLGGTADLRRGTPGASAPRAGPGGSSAGGDLTVALDSLVISDGIALTGLQGRFSDNGGLSGTFRATVNGGAPVSGVIAPAAGGRSAFRLRSDDAGAVFRSAGVFGKAHGGTLDMVLTPRNGAGDYDGRLQVRDTRVRQAPVLADLLGAISVIGLLEQLNGQGLVFSDVDADFRLTPQTIEVISASATGNSLGISLAGVYGLTSKRMEMQGVISPVYMLNAIGGIFSPRRGEGLIGVNYRLSGEAARPQVQVNPLSVLAPGALRELFRRARPVVTE